MHIIAGNVVFMKKIHGTRGKSGLKNGLLGLNFEKNGILLKMYLQKISLRSWIRFLMRSLNNNMIKRKQDFKESPYLCAYGMLYSISLLKTGLRLHITPDKRGIKYFLKFAYRHFFYPQSVKRILLAASQRFIYSI